MPTLSPGQIYTYAVAAGFKPMPSNEALVATAVALAESSGRTDVVNASGNVGLWQIGASGARNDAGLGLSVAQLKDPATNARAARTMFVRDGNTFAKHWETWGSGAAGRELAKLLQPGVSGLVGSGLEGVGKGAAAAGSGTGAILQDTGGALAQTVGDMQKGVLGQVGTVLEWLTTPAKWLRVAYVVGGGVLVITGVNMLAKPVTAPVVGGVKKAVKVVT